MNNLREYTGYDDRLGNPIFTSDLVSFRCPNPYMSGKGVVVKGADIGMPEWEFCIQDTRKAPECKKRNEGRIYPFYEDAVYTIKERAVSEEDKAESERKIIYCDDCILLDICGKEGCCDESMAFCSDKNKFIHASILDRIRDEIAVYKDDKIIHEERNEMIDIILEIIDRHISGMAESEG